MGRAGGLVMGAIVLGLALALALVAALDPPKPGASALQISGADAPPDEGDTPRRCRSVTEADPECEAAWEAKRRHFFRSGKPEQ
ncbi:MULTISPECIES: putative entry exclusion protein TrbK-alt [Sphingopyxis]|jgi:conjugative transfer region protein TrbK|uniref:Secreted protein n=1 Tax=Sphingopyxis granuli TaxID=267128 RepID=A0AA86L510_9SPHN|nr:MULTISPECIES: putative entry exclusion protein TrbK-alt [Sphingopyxis]AMG75520.1 Putative secreted protein [Sphingopyxis granuli]HEV7312487.1 putative entry exclusion protein TrbK-alt [Sphingopyxis sp.]